MVDELVRRYPDLWLSRSWTTRPRRPAESADAYVFVTRAEFESKIELGGFLEYAEFLGNYYGTPIPEAPSGRDVILEIDVQGARQVVEQQPDALLLFLVAPSPSEQQARLRMRGDPEHQVQQRLQKAAEEAHAGEELGATVVVNRDVGETADEIYQAIRQARRERLA